MIVFRKKIGVVAIFISLIGSYLYLNLAQRHILDRNEFALSLTNTTRTEKLDGLLISANKFDEIHILIERLKTKNCLSKSVLWLGNSQQHTINDYADGDHLSIFWLADYLKTYGFESGCVVGISLPNINPQEILYLLHYLEDQDVYFNKIIIPLEFLGYREFGVRDEVKSNLKEQKTLVENHEFIVKGSEKFDFVSEVTKLFVPAWLENIDKYLDYELKSRSPIWNNRLDIQSTFLMNLFMFIC